MCRFLHILFVFLLLPIVLIGQKIPIGIPEEYRDVRVLPNYDTLVMSRQQTPYWFGVNGGANFNMYFSDLNVPLSKYGYITGEEVNHVFPKLLVDFPTSLGTGWFVGLVGEYMEPLEDWAVGIKLQVVDARHTEAQTDPIKDSVRTRFVAANNFNYLTFSPYFRYNLPSWQFPGLHLFAGADVEIKTNIDTKIRKTFDYTSTIDHDRSLKFKGKDARIGFYLGIGLDIFAGDIWNRFRGRITPYIEVHAGSNILNDFNSSRNTVYARAGASLRFSRDTYYADTLKFDSTSLPPLMAISTVVFERGISFSYEPRSFIGGELSIFESISGEEIASKETGIVGKAEVTPETTPAPPPAAPQITIRPDVTERFSFSTSSNVELSKEMETYLDAVANYMKSNPNFIVRLFGHSDQLGTAQQQQDRSDIRANNAMRYLMSKGIPRGRIIPRGDAARVPIGDIRTEAGRRQNRRLEIVIMQR